MRRPIKRVALCIIVSMSILLSAAAAEALAATEVRILHAVPGAAKAELKVEGAEGEATTLPPVGFGEASEYSSPQAGSVTATVLVDGRPFAGTTELEGDGRYTIVASLKADSEIVTLYEDGRAVAGKTRWRVVHAAAELDTAELMLDGRSLGELGRGEEADYSTVEPGVHTIGARRPGEEGALVESPDVSLVAGTAQTAYLVGSGGEPTRFTVLQDDASAPSVAPATGLGGLGDDGGPSWRAALLAAALAGALGGAAYAGANVRHHRRRS